VFAAGFSPAGAPPKGHTRKLSGKRTDRVEGLAHRAAFRTLERGGSSQLRGGTIRTPPLLASRPPKGRAQR